LFNRNYPKRCITYTILPEEVSINKPGINKESKLVIITIAELLYSVFAVMWFFIPQFVFDNRLVQPLFLPFISFSTLNFSYILVLIPLIGVFKVFSLFLRKRLAFFCSPDRFGAIFLNILSTCILIGIYVYYLLKTSSSVKFFYTQDLKFYLCSSLVLVFNLVFTYGLLRSLVQMDAAYKSFISFMKLDKLEKKQIKFFISIQKKLIISILSTIIIVIVILSYLVLNDYRNTIIKSVEYIGRTIAEQSAAVFKENYSDNVNINSYLNKEKVKNEQYELKFETLTFYKKQGKEDIFIAMNSTDQKRIGIVLDSEKLNLYDAKTFSGLVIDDENKIFRFVESVKIKDKILGYSVLRYREDLIYESYFRAQIRVILFTLLSVYILFILIYVIGNRIVFPLLFLRMNVKKISASLSRMISGEEKVSADQLTYNDEIRTKDEIKALSREIKGMTTIIKGMMPYVSVSTFQQSRNKKDDSKTTIKNLAFIFTDIRGFTSICEGLAPDKVIETINHYLTAQTEIIYKHHGDVDKFVGDSIMAEFDGPNKEINACNASMDLIEMMRKDKEERVKNKLTTADIGIGINTGSVVYGSIGAKERMDFTSIGDTVNLASRLEGANKEYFTKLLISESVYKKIKENFICREIDLLTVKGKTEHVRIYEILQKAAKPLKALVSLKTDFEQALSLYRNQKWEDALRAFQEIYNESKDKTSKVFIDRIKLFMHHSPPENWDGVFALNVK
jgi:adenylate cyclase